MNPFRLHWSKLGLLAVLVVVGCNRLSDTPNAKRNSQTESQPKQLANTNPQKTTKTQAPEPPKDGTPTKAKTPPKKNVEHPIEALVKKLGGRVEYNKDESEPVIEKVRLVSSQKVKDEDLAFLEQVPNLKYLNVTQAKITDKGLVHLRHVPELEEFHFLNCRIGDEGMKHVAKLKHLKVLDMSSSVTDTGFAELNTPNNLRDVSFSFGCTDKSLAHLANFNQLERVSLFGRNYSTQGIRRLAQLPKLKELVLFSVNSDRDKLFPVLAEFQPLEKLEFRTSSADTEADLKYLIELKNLRDLDLYRMELSGEGMELLGKMKNLERLLVNGKGISDEDLLRLKGLTNLRYLHLSGTSTTKAGVAEFRKVLPMVGIGRNR